MNAKVRITTAAGVLLGSASPALAENGIRGDHSGIIIWTFLGFCALIVVAQLMPVLGNLLSKKKITPMEEAPAKSTLGD